MDCWEDGKRAELSAEFPGWDIWYVRNVVERSGTWCARPKGAPVAIFHSPDPDGLAWKLRMAETQVGRP